MVVKQRDKTSKDRIKRNQKKIQNKTVKFKSLTFTINQRKIAKCKILIKLKSKSGRTYLIF